MNTLIITRAKLTYTTLVLVCALAALIAPSAHAEWSVDFSRRAKAIREADLSDAAHDVHENAYSRSPASVSAPTGAAPIVAAEDYGKKDEAAKGLLETLFDKGEPVQEIVILNTEKGFVPSTVRVRKDGRYKISIVNVNEKEKNVSFILDGFSEHHSTYFGKVKSFALEPKKDGVFSFQSPETGMEGKLVVFAPQMSVRAPASDK